MPRKIGKRRKGRRIAGTRRPRVRAARVELEEGRRGTTQRREDVSHLGHGRRSAAAQEEEPTRSSPMIDPEVH
jgi:hypothetical protein